MLVSFYVHLRPLAPARADRHVGRWLNGLLYHLVGEADPDLANEWHHLTKLKPFTVSTLLGRFHEVNGVRTALPDESYRVRYTLLSDAGVAALSQVLLARYLERRPLTIGKQPFEILRVETAERSRDPWLGSTSYEALAEAPRPTRSLAFDFASPTAFRRGEQSFLFPVPESVFHSLARTWRAFCDIPLPDDLGDFVLEQLPASRYELRTDVIQAGKYQLLGFTGQVSYRVLDPDPRYLAALNMLADFALYAGVGMKTTQGMGQARRVAPP